MTEFLLETAMAAPPTAAVPGDDGDSSKTGRRKACDLCFTKKIKCDMLKPICSNCKLYKAQCRTSIIRRKANPPRPRPIPITNIQTSAPANSSDNVTGSGNQEADDKKAMEDRLARIERQLQQVLDVAASLGARADNSSDGFAPGTTSQQNRSSDNPGTTSTRTPTTTGALSSTSSPPVFPDSNSASRDDSANDGPPVYGPTSVDSASSFIFDSNLASADEFALPPLQELQPIVDHYFNTFNSVVPLFHQQTFMRMFNSWFDRPGTRHRASWAAILIVAAIGLRVPRNGRGDMGQERINYANSCLRNAQSVVSELVNREEDLLGIQVLLGIVILFRNSADPRPASVVIGTALRLAHRLQLHSKAARQYFSPEEAEQRSRVFWIAYSLDKTIALRTRTPSVQLDADIDTPLPPLAPMDGAGLIWTLDGRSHLNYHRQRAELAHIEGKVFDLLYSNRAVRVRGVERQRNVTRLAAMLDGWYQRLPAAFSIDNVRSTVGSWELLELTKLLHTYLGAYIMASGLYSHNSDWVRQMSSSGRAAVQDLAMSKGPDGNLRLQDHDAPPQTTWEKCVELSRGCMKLYQYTMPTECLIWQCSCVHFSSLIVLLANLYMHPTHASVAEDQALTARALHAFDRTIEMFKYPSCGSLRCVVHELMQKADMAVEGARAMLADDAMGGSGTSAGYVPFSVHMDVFPEAQNMGTGISDDDVFVALFDQDAAHDTIFDVFGMDPASNVMAPISDVA